MKFEQVSTGLVMGLGPTEIVLIAVIVPIVIGLMIGLKQEFTVLAAIAGMVALVVTA